MRHERPRAGDPTPDAADGRDIAIVGLACRLPGAPDAPAFWAMLQAGADAVREIPPERWDAARYYAPAHGRPGKAATRWGAFLDGIDLFDAAYFRISPREAKSLDPQQRLLLEVAAEALENGGLSPDRLAGSRTGVYVGICGSEYATLAGVGDDYAAMDKYYGTGTALSVAAGRIAYAFDLAGPAISVETACSSSLVAVHLAVGALRQGEADLCLAGGVNVALSPAVGIYFSQVGAVSREPACRPFDDAADGYVRGEGCGLVALKRLPDAMRDGDRVLAVIRGSAVNQDGRSAGLTAPNGAAQEAAIRAALADARVAPQAVGYVETHGTGTRLGDPIEANALGAVYGRAPGRREPLRLGAVKGNIGHLEAAAGIAGLIKAVLALQSGTVPPQPNLRVRNAVVDWEALRLDVPTAARPWPTRGPDGAPALAAVSSFGFSGTNAHVVLAPPPAVPARAAEPALTGGLVLPVSARAPGALAALAEAFARRLEGASDAEAAALCRATALRRAHHLFRLCAVGADAQGLAADLQRRAAEARDARARARDETGALAFVFSGQGSMWIGMGAALAAYPQARACLAEIDALVAQQAGWSPLAAMASEAGGPDGAIETTQVCVFAAQIALFRQLAAWGLQPAAVAGHSMGEIAAACAAGALTLAQATRLALVRSRLLGEVGGRGLMVAVEIGAEEAARAIAEAGLAVSVAAVNGPGSCVVSGASAPVRDLTARLESAGVHCRALRTGGVAGHSPVVAPLAERLEAALADLAPRDGEAAFVSALDGDVRPGRSLDAAYWGHNLVAPVRFDRALEGLIAAGARDLVEVAPKPLLLPALRGALERAGLAGAALETLHPDREPAESLGRLVAGLYRAGRALDWAALHPEEGAWSPWPSYPWQRERHWIDQLAPPAPATATAEAAQPEPDAASRDETALSTVIARHDEAGVRAANMARLAPFVLLSADGACAFWLARRGGVVLAFAWLGPEARFAEEVARLRADCARLGLAPCLLVDAPAAAGLDGFLALEAGASHRIAPLAGFDLDAPGLKRLRARLRRYAADGGGRTQDWSPGRDDADDADALALIDGWRAARPRPVPAAQAVRAAIRRGETPAHGRFVVARRDGRIVALVLLTRFGAGTGWLLDLEFHDSRTPPGCTETLVVDCVRMLAAEGARALSLGGSYRGAPGEAGDADPQSAFARQRRFKRKLGAQETSILLLRPPDLTPAQADDLIALTAGLGEPAAPRIARRLADLLAGEGAPAHPLLGERLSLAGTTRVYESRIAAAHPLAAQHRIGGAAVLPGAASLELAVAAAWDDRRGRALVLEDVVFERPLVLAEGETVRVQTHLETRGGAPVRFSIHAEAAGEWVRIAHGGIAFAPPGEAATAAPQPPEAAREVDPQALRARLAQAGIAYGPLFSGLRRVAIADGLIAAEAALPEGEAQGYRMHPALLDAALQSFAAAEDAQAGAARGLMIQSLARLVVRRALPQAVRVAAAIRSEPQETVAAGDLALSAPDGTALLEATGLIARPAAAPARLRTARLEPRPIPPPAAEPGGGIVLLAGGGALGEALAAALREAGRPVARVDACAAALPDALAALPGETWRAATRLALLPEAETAADVDPAALGPRLATAPDLLRLLSDRAGAGLRTWIVTRGAHDADAATEAVGEAALWGLGAVWRAEEPGLWGGSCDLARACPDDAAAAALAAILLGSGDEDALRVTGAGLAGLRLVESPPPAGAPLAIRSDAAYLVTGWSGGVGRRLVRRLIAAGAGRVVLLARTPPEAAGLAPLAAAARASGTDLVARAGDVADRAVVASAVAAAEREGVALRGVFHAAGALADGLLATQDEHGFAAAWRAKVAGALALHAQTRGRALDAFVLLSSAASLFGPPGQGPHAAESAALDRLAAWRRAQGLPATSLGFGAFAGIGRAAALGVDARLAAGGLTPLDPEAAFATMEALAAADVASAYLAPADWRAWAAATPDGARRALFREVLAAASCASRAAPEPDADTSRPAAPGDVAGALRASVAAALLCDPAALDGEASLERNGLDSIMIVEVRERLGRTLGRTLPLIDFFREPSLVRLAARIATRLAEDAAA
ncbi:SDR family NAD(P)-dependent oxidoreductase [Salinarimonas sp.]|uniref:type I polyketide synthase n=1 Tax=Salinarimonas sp. TaxID=2766526 RepID=UPI0032D902C7